jgi:Tol biopolymer transport system component
MSRKKLLAFPIILFIFLGTLLSLWRIAGSGLQPVTAKEGDYLVYAVSPSLSSNSQFMLYDPAENTHVPILPDWNIRVLSMNANGRLAFSSLQEGISTIYVADYPFTNGIPVNITGYPRAWSPDGRYLLYSSFQDNETTLSIWDGESSTQIFHSPAHISEITWSQDGRLAFTLFDTPDGDESEIYIWDGDETVSLTQNPTGEDRYPVWNEDGHLAFLSERAGVYDIFIWDGTSTINGLPDVHSFSNIAPSLTDYSTMPVWSSSGSLTFTGSGPGDGYIHIYEWDGAVATNISQNRDFHSVGQQWRSDGYWSFSTGLLSGEQLVYIRDEHNKTQLIQEGYGVRWSESGYFIFCQRIVTGTRWSFTDVGLPEIVKEY